MSGKPTAEERKAAKEAQEKEIARIAAALKQMLSKLPPAVREWDAIKVANFKAWHREAMSKANSKRPKLDVLAGIHAQATREWY